MLSVMNRVGENPGETYLSFFTGTIFKGDDVGLAPEHIWWSFNLAIWLVVFSGALVSSLLKPGAQLLNATW